ncbi:YggS family pyridoxal phosphate-dependent enzyme [Nannocystaceae bacterium ST9]
MTAIADELARVRDRIAAAIDRRGPGPEVRLIGVSKKQPLAKLLAAHEAGLREFGENYAQELRDKQGEWPLSHESPRWHFIGALQTNKLKYVVGKALIHTVDRLELLQAIDRRAASLSAIQEFLVEVDLAGEDQKAGVRPDDLPGLLDACAELEAVRCVGLMIIPPVEGDPEASRGWFARLRALAEQLRSQPRAHVELRELSMGMSADFEQAIEEGATLVRVGTAIFGAR